MINSRIPSSEMLLTRVCAFPQTDVAVRDIQRIYDAPSNFRNVVAGATKGGGRL